MDPQTHSSSVLPISQRQASESTVLHGIESTLLHGFIR